MQERNLCSQGTSRAPNNNKQPCPCPFTSFSASVSTLNQKIFTYLVQRRSFPSSCYHFNVKQAFKVNNLAPMTMQPRSLSLVACSLSSQRSRMLMQKRPLLLCYGLKKIHTRNMLTKKNSSGSKFPTPGAHPR